MKNLVTPSLRKKVLQVREKLNQYAIVIAREKGTDRVLGFKPVYKTNCHYDMETIFGKEFMKRDFLTEEFYVGDLNG